MSRSKCGSSIQVTGHIMYELRILNGLHRGATLPLDDQAQVIGQSEDADVVLVDQGIAERHAVLTLRESGWSLEQLDGEVRGSEHNTPGTQAGLAPGDFARVGNVWVTVVDEGADWSDAPPEPADAANGMEADVYGDENDDGQMPVMDAYADSGTPDLSRQIEGIDLAARVDDVAQSIAGETMAVNKPRKIFSARRLMWPVSLVAVISVAAYAMGSQSDPKENTRRIAAAALQDEVASAGPEVAPRLKSSLSVATPPGMPQEALRQAFRNRLEEVDLLKRFNLSLNDNNWEMQASLDEEDAARFKRILEGFIAANHIKFPIAVKIGTTEALLPFKIQQVISGANASIVTEDGNRMYVGDEYKGMRLTQIVGNKLSFAGKRSMDVRW